jgi:hypothetical protein
MTNNVPKPLSGRKQVCLRLSLEAEQKLRCLLDSLELVTTTQNPIAGEMVVKRTKYSRTGLAHALLQKAIEDLYRETPQ